MLAKCDAIAEDELAVDRSLLPIEELARIGEVAEALRHLNRFLKRLPNEEVTATVRLALAGAQIALKAGDLITMEKYLARAAATEVYDTRKSEKGASENAVRDFRAFHGLLEPADAIDDEQRIEAHFSRARRQFHLAMEAGDRTAAVNQLTELERSARESKGHWRRRLDLGLVVRLYAQLNDADSLRGCIRRMTKAERDTVLDARTLIELGMTKDGIALAKKTLKAELARLATSRDPDINSPVNSICNMLKLLVNQGERETANRWLQRVFREMPKWPVYRKGWITSGVYTDLAEVTALLEGRESAMELLEHGLKDGRAEPRRDFGGGAVQAAIQMKATIGALDEAIADARKLRSPTLRRMELGRLLAKAKRWKELAEVLSEVASPEEAAEVSWWIKFELPGGER